MTKPDPYIVLLRVLAQLPWFALRGLGWLTGTLFWALAAKRRHYASVNIRLCLPELNEKQRRRLVYRSFIEGGYFLAECAPVWLRGYQRLADRTDSSEVEQQLSELAAGDRPVILATPHLGNWEVLGLYLPKVVTMTSMYKPAEKAVEQVIRKARQRTGAKLVPSDMAGVKSMLVALKKGETVGLLPDQGVKQRNGVVAPFFGINTTTMTLTQKLSRKTNARMFMAWAERQPGSRFKLRLLEAAPGYDDADPVIAATALNKSVEAAIRECPEQYWWSYPRFRHRAEGAEPPY